ncbi:hypothetical protein R1sor_017280 [Riccia sorocarpa]|uniref:Uncharacterized protein n=1 Tax=Riccia sorocarpa TaxID=122646 RepID=A0ABD3I6C1_9MARC
MQTSTPAPNDPAFARAVALALQCLMETRDEEITRFLIQRGKFKTILSSRAAQQQVLQAPSPIIHEVPSMTIPWTLDAELPDFTPPVHPTWIELPDPFHISEQQRQQQEQADLLRHLLHQRLLPRSALPIPTASAPEHTLHTFIFGMELNQTGRPPQPPINLNDNPEDLPQPPVAQQPMEVDPAPASDTEDASSINMDQAVPLHQGDQIHPSEQGHTTYEYPHGT